MRSLFLGDLVGRSGREAVLAAIPDLRARLDLDLLVVNGENASHGFGLSPDIAQALLTAGADVITLGNHSWDRKELIPYMASESRVVRPNNYPAGTPGQGAVLVETRRGQKALVMNVMGRLFMESLDCPFRTTAEALAKYKLGRNVDFILLDFHAEASSEKMAFGHSFDGSVSMVVGTHTHCPTADTQILPGGTAYQSDAGMCGDYDSVIGMDKLAAGTRFWRPHEKVRLEPASGEATICGVYVETDDATGLAVKVSPLRMGGRLAPIWPA
jgi:2',3'-cyclic-nucleotide 2'-phosphodiesterase